MVAAPVLAAREEALRALLEGMCAAPGMAAPDNALVPFGVFAELHVARFVILHDTTLGDLAQYGTDFPDPPDRKSTRLNSSHIQKSRMPSSA